jgi:hypothetical protein
MLNPSSRSNRCIAFAKNPAGFGIVPGIERSILLVG